MRTVRRNCANQWLDDNGNLIVSVLTNGVVFIPARYLPTERAYVATSRASALRMAARLADTLTRQIAKAGSR